MRIRLPWLLLGLSALLNLSLIVGVIYAASMSGEQLRGEALIQEVGHELNLDNAQMTNLQKLRAVRMEQRSERQGRGWQELMADALEGKGYDTAAVRQELAARDEGRIDRTLDLMDAMHSFGASLNGQQRQAFTAQLTSDSSFFWRLIAR